MGDPLKVRKPSPTLGASAVRNSAPTLTSGRSPLAEAGNAAAVRRLTGGTETAPRATPQFVVTTEARPSATCADFYLRNPERSFGMKGTTVHAALRSWFATTYGVPAGLVIPDSSKGLLSENYQAPRPPGPGYPDLDYLSTYLKTIEIAELKPASPNGFSKGSEDLDWYLDHGNRPEALAEINRWFPTRIARVAPMEPWKFPLPPQLQVGNKRYGFLWCMPGLILYKEIPQEKKREQQREKAEGRSASAPWVARVKPILEPRPVALPSWVPAGLKEALAKGDIRVGLELSRWKVTWPGGFESRLLVNRSGSSVELRALWPEDRDFYERAATRLAERGDLHWSMDAETLARRTYEVFTVWNRDLVGLLASKQYTSIEEAESRLRTVNADVTQQLLTAIGQAFGSAGVLGGGARAPSARTARSAIGGTRGATTLEEFMEELFGPAARRSVAAPVP